MSETETADSAVYEDGTAGDEPIAIDDCSVDPELRFEDHSVEDAEPEPSIAAEAEATYSPDGPSAEEESYADDGCLDQGPLAAIDAVRGYPASFGFAADDGTFEAIRSAEAGFDFPSYEDGDVGYEPVTECDSIDEEDES